MRLFSYTVRVDDGAAPNPYGGVCTLGICKPAIRLKAKRGDWIIGLGPTRGPAPKRECLSDHVIYAMQVSDKLLYERYDRYCQEHLTAKLPLWSPAEPHQHQVGDCIYHLPWDGDKLQQRRGVHNERNVKTDMRGKFVLLAKEKFFYFGDYPVVLPKKFHSICHPFQGHKVNANEAIKDKVVAWMEAGFGRNLRPRILYGQPLHKSVIRPGKNKATWSACGGIRADEVDDICTIC